MSTIYLRELVPTYKRVRKEDDQRLTKKIASSRDVYALFHNITQSPKEVFIAVFLDTKNCILCYETISIGGRSAAIVDPVSVFSSTLLAGASALLTIHNHPSGNTQESKEDRDIAKRLKEGAEILGLKFLDFIICADQGHKSFADEVLL